MYMTFRNETSRSKYDLYNLRISTRLKLFRSNATVTPIPALFAVRHARPVVIVAARRTNDPYYFEGFVSDPI
jgi:hypothetical protein